MSSPPDAADSRRALFIVLEGVDGSGKTTQAHLLAEWLGGQGFPVVLTREPGGTELGERLRTIIRDPTVVCAPRTELLLILAARAQHVAEVIAPALAAGKVVVSDRFSLSSLAYQGFGRGLPLAEVREADAVATGGVSPDLTVLVDVPVEAAMSRLGVCEDRFEGEGLEFLRRVVAGYRRLCAENASIRLIDGTGSVEAVQRAIRREIDRSQIGLSRCGGNR